MAHVMWLDVADRWAYWLYFIIHIFVTAKSFVLPDLVLLFQLDKTKLKPGTRVALDMTTLTIMR